MILVPGLLAILLAGYVLNVQAAEYDSTTTVTTTPTITSTTTVNVVEEIFETEYIYTNSLGSLTTSVVVGSTAIVPSIQETDASSAYAQSTIGSSSLSSDALSSASTDQIIPSSTETESDTVTTLFTDSLSASATSIPISDYLTDVISSSLTLTVNQSAVPSGDYTTSTYATTTVLDGSSSSVVLEYVVLYTDSCSN